MTAKFFSSSKQQFKMNEWMNIDAALILNSENNINEFT